MELCPAPTLPRQEILSLSLGRCKGWGDRESPLRGGLRGRGRPGSYEITTMVQ